MPISSRRTFLGAAVVLAAGGAGVAVGLQSKHEKVAKPVAPVVRHAPVLEAVLARETALVARLDAAARTAPVLRSEIDILRADHRAHVAALQALVRAAGGVVPTVAGSATTLSTVPSPARATSSAAAPAVTSAMLRAWEKAAARSAGTACAETPGTAAAALASIYACEQTHLAWLP